VEGHTEIARIIGSFETAVNNVLFLSSEMQCKSNRLSGLSVKTIFKMMAVDIAKEECIW